MRREAGETDVAEHWGLLLRWRCCAEHWGRRDSVGTVRMGQTPAVLRCREYPAGFL